MDPIGAFYEAIGRQVRGHALPEILEIQIFYFSMPIK
jgi:hypothetical protein